jgi:hypothetical protein
VTDLVSWVLVVVGAFVLGCLVGYILRALMSRRRRFHAQQRRALAIGKEAAGFRLTLQRPSSEQTASGLSISEEAPTLVPQERGVGELPNARGEQPKFGRLAFPRRPRRS